MEPKIRRLWIVALALVVILAVAAGYVMADCNTYYNSRITYEDGYTFCGGSGSTCTECTDDTGGSCVTNGMTCEPFRDSPNP